MPEDRDGAAVLRHRLEGFKRYLISPLPSQPEGAQLRGEPIGMAAQVVVPQPLRRVQKLCFFGNRAGAVAGSVGSVEADLPPVGVRACQRLGEGGPGALRVAVVRVLLAGEEEARR